MAEFVSPSSRKRDRLDKPALCANEGIPYFLRVEVDYAEQNVQLELSRLVSGGYDIHAKAAVGEVFRAEQPFSVELDPAELLER